MFMMTSYNENNGWPSGDNYDVCTDLARGEWGFNGLIMTDWNGGQSSPHISMHAGNDMITPGKAVTTISNYLGKVDPDFTEDGYVSYTETTDRRGRVTITYNWGNFVLDADGDPIYKVPTNAQSEDELNDNIKTAIANRTAKYEKIGNEATVTWYGFHNSICRGDVQKSALNILGAFLYTQDMKILCEELGVDYETFGEAMDAPMADEDYVGMADKGAVEYNGIVAEKVTVDTAEVETAEVNVEYKGEKELTTVRLIVDSALPIAEITSANDFEYNPADGRIIVYKADGSAIDPALFTISYEFDDLVADGEYPVALTLIEVTDIDGNVTDASTVNGAVIIDNTYAAGDVNLDGAVDNRDLIMIAKYLVGLVEFNEKQLEAADYNKNGEINNQDLVLIARAIVAA